MPLVGRGGLRVLRAVEELGVATLPQLARLLGGAALRHVYALVRVGALRSVSVGGFVFYYVDPRDAVETILASADPARLSREDKERLAMLASEPPRLDAVEGSPPGLAASLWGFIRRGVSGIGQVLRGSAPRSRRRGGRGGVLAMSLPAGVRRAESAYHACRRRGR